MFRTKSKTEQVQEQAAAAASNAATQVSEHLRERVVPAVGHAAEAAKDWGKPHVEAARDWAKPRVEHGIEITAPKLETAVTNLAPKVDTARDKIVDDMLPRVAEAIAALAAATAAAKTEAAARGAGAGAVLKGEAVAKPKHRKGRLLLVLGIIAGAAAAAGAVIKQRSAPKEDPWATPLPSSYTPPEAGRASTMTPAPEAVTPVTPAEAAAAAEATSGEEVTDAVSEDVDETTGGPDKPAGSTD